MEIWSKEIPYFTLKNLLDSLLYLTSQEVRPGGDFVPYARWGYGRKSNARGKSWRERGTMNVKNCLRHYVRVSQGGSNLFLYLVLLFFLWRWFRWLRDIWNDGWSVMNPVIVGFMCSGADLFYFLWDFSFWSLYMPGPSLSLTLLLILVRSYSSLPLSLYLALALSVLSHLFSLTWFCSLSSSLSLYPSL